MISEESGLIGDYINKECFTSSQQKTKIHKIRLAKEHCKKWKEEETKIFYKGIQLFGTDFSMISTIFENRNRKMCKVIKK